MNLFTQIMKLEPQKIMKKEMQIRQNEKMVYIIFIQINENG